jgi:hypothetical protein
MGIYHDQVIDAAYLHTKPGCFYIGPFARRVSFASQQYRALDLVAALVEKNKLVYPAGHPKAGRPKHVAIVGAGIAGLTAATALRGQACKVHVYERLSEPLLVQRHAAHRLIHPTISRWPATPLELTTDFPFLDWFAAPCDRVIATMQEEWNERLLPKEADGDFAFFGGATIVDVRPFKDVMRLMVDPSGAGPGIVDYDYVFVTTGFAEEETEPGHDVVSYWTQDKIDLWRQSQRGVYVSGCGDGGLIDALRLVHGDFDGGWLAIRLAHLLTGWLDHEIVNAESDALMAAKSLECMKMMAQGASAESGAPMRKVGGRYEDNSIARTLTDFYRNKVVPNLPPAAEALLDSSLQKAGVAFGKVTLVSRQEEPFGPHSAPIHKIMVEHAIAAGRISYRRGELEVQGGRKVIRMLDGGDPVEIGDDMGLVVRHGSPANLTGLASRDESGSLRIRQYMLADYIETDKRPFLPPPPGYPRCDSLKDRSRYIGIRWRMAQELMASVAPGTAVSATPDRFVYWRASVPPPGGNFGELPTPKKLFGIPIEPDAMPRAQAL